MQFFFFIGSNCLTLSLRKHPFLLALRLWGRFARRNVPSGEERGETDIFAGYLPLQSLFFQQLSYLMYDVHAKTALIA